jgi:NTP-dependent ternary system trypsin peptidase co-occuring protein
MQSDSNGPASLLEQGLITTIPETLSRLRAELREARKRQIEDLATEAGREIPLTFLIEEVTVQLEIVSLRSESIEGKVGIYVLTANAQTKFDNASKQVLTLKLKLAEAAAFFCGDDEESTGGASSDAKKDSGR